MDRVTPSNNLRLCISAPCKENWMSYKDLIETSEFSLGIIKWSEFHANERKMSLKGSFELSVKSFIYLKLLLEEHKNMINMDVYANYTLVNETFPEGNSIGLTLVSGNEGILNIEPTVIKSSKVCVDFMYLGRVNESGKCCSKSVK